jgi:hypothetical protein
VSRPIAPEQLAATPALAALLARLRRRLVAQVWLHGVGGILVALCTWLAFVFFADRALHVPLAVRWFHLAVLVALPIALFWREVVRHLRRVPDAAGLAVLVERAHPELHELLVTAVQVQARDARDVDAELRSRILRDADLRARSLDLQGVLVERPQALRALAGFAALALAFLGALYGGDTTRIFLQRLIGGDVPWPQRTTLELIVADPARPGEFLRSEGELAVRIARGTDLPIAIHARGELPSEVVLHFKDGGDAVLASASDGEFRTLLRSLQEPLELHATGGDDEDQLPRLRVEVLDPPDIASLAIEITPPPYVRASARVEYDRDVQVLAGSKLSIRILPTPEEASGSVRVLPADTLMLLEPRPFPLRDGETQVRTGLGFELVAEQSLRYRFELRDATGLVDPDPGLFSVDVLADERPEVELVSPARLEVETLAQGALRLGARAIDDLGITSLAWRARTVGQQERNGNWNELPLRDAPLPMRGDESQRGVAVTGGMRIDVAALAAEGTTLAIGDLFELELRALDTRPAVDGAPDPRGTGTSTPVRLRIVGEEEFLRRLQDRLSRARGDVASLDELLRAQTARTRDLLNALESSGELPGSAELSAALAGERRVLGDGEALVREFAGALESVLYARVDEKALGLLELLDAELAQVTNKSFPLGNWRRFAEALRAQGSPPAGIASQLSGLFDLALRASADELAEASAALERASRRADLAQVQDELALASAHEAKAAEHLASLLDRLAEWDNFQSILTLTRDILGRQKSIRDKTADMTGNRSK